ncbi:MAG: dTDP-glucose 4,6-dehydratase [Frankiaceae bacterium]|jgi:dTDP-glucose 4,6-dehydratase|nr:dTDP-glucose 4,6-dehydratase [Frankiaceae bacterium]
MANAHDPSERSDMVERPRAVIAGGAGFLGSHICDRLVHDGWSVVCLDNFCTGAAKNVSHLIDTGQFELLDCDVTRPLPVVGRVDAVLNFASPASPPDYLRLPFETLRVGSIGTLNLLELAKDKGARFVMASTSETYGDPQVHPQTEDYWGYVNPVGPRAVYDEAKRFSEAATMAYSRSANVNTGILRFFNTHGPRMRPDDGRAVPTFIQQCLVGAPITVAGDGSQTRSIQYVDDLVEGVMRFMRSEHTGPMNLGNPEEVTMLTLARTINEMCGSLSEITFIDRPIDDPSVRCPDIKLAADVLDWAPRVRLADGLERTIAWFRGA